MIRADDGLEPRCFALVPCAGSGSRAGTTTPKQYAQVAGRPLVAHTLDALAQVSRLAATLVVLSPEDRDFERALPAFAGERGWISRVGGANRAATVAQGLLELQARGAGPQDWVLVHDAARCLLRPEWVDRLIDACGDDPVGGLLALPLADTLKSETSGRVQSTVDRQAKWAAQTPQMFRLGLLSAALQAAAAEGKATTDESSAIEALGQAPKLVRGELENLKVTWPGDFALAERLLQYRESTLTAVTTARPTAPQLRIGEGWDTHALVSGRPLVLGGVLIPHSHGLLGHSDADALLHAITDALFGAAALGDIGQHFPDTDLAFRGADSGALLAECARRVRAAGWDIVNLDATVIAQAPRLATHKPAMTARIAALLGLDAGQINLKAKTAEKMGPVGEGRAIEARAVCLLTRV